jgi:hypothetical protein
VGTITNQHPANASGNSKQRRNKERQAQREGSPKKLTSTISSKDQLQFGDRSSHKPATISSQKTDKAQQLLAGRKTPELSTIWQKLKDNTVTPRSYLFTLISNSWRLVTGVGVIVGLIGFFYPRIDASVAAELDGQNPLKTAFTIKNSGYMPLVNLKYSCALDELKLKDETRLLRHPNERPYSVRAVNKSHGAAHLGINESDKVSCALSEFEGAPLLKPERFQFLDIALVVEYSIPFIPVLRLEKELPFTSVKDINGKFYWVQRPSRR